MTKYLIVAIIILLVGTCFLFRENKSLRSECDRQSGNMETLMRTVRKYKYADSLNGVSLSALNLTIDELKEYREDDARLIKELGIKNKNLEAIIKAGVHTSDTITKEYWHPVPDNPDCLEYSDKWAKVTACFKDSTVMYAVRDSIATVVHRIPKRRFLWWSWGTKGYQVELINFNPRSEIDYSEFIQIAK